MSAAVKRKMSQAEIKRWCIEFPIDAAARTANAQIGLGEQPLTVAEKRALVRRLAKALGVSK